MKKRVIALLIAGALATAALLSGCGSNADAKEGTEAATAAQETTAAEETAAPETEAATTAAATEKATEAATEEVSYDKYAGNYSADVTSATVTVDGDTFRFKFQEGSAANIRATWEMSGTIDPDTFKVNYSDCKKTAYNDDGTTKVEYENGDGRVIFGEKSFTWENETDGAGAGLEFAME